MSQQDSKPVTIEETKDRVILKVGTLEVGMSPSFAREVGEALYKSGCNVSNKAEKK